MATTQGLIWWARARLRSGYARAVEWTLTRLPAPLLLNPERVAIKGMCAIAGVATLIFVRPTSLTALLPLWVIYVWGAAWLLGGTFGLTGYWRNRRAVEMAGHRFILLGAIVYAIAIGRVAGVGGLVSILLAGVVAGCSAVRLLIAAGAKLSRTRAQ